MTKIDIFSGFLGAGKTTLIKKMIAESYKGQKLVLIENEFGEIGIDGGFLQDSGINITEMNSGCICCSLVGDFGKALKKVIAEYHPDRILIEPSGVGKLSDVIAAVSKVTNDEVTLGYTVAVADAGKVKVYMKNFGEFYNNQIETASTIILSRTDSIPQSKLDAAVAMLREHNSVATIVTTPWGELTGEQLIEALEGKTITAAITIIMTMTTSTIITAATITMMTMMRMNTTIITITMMTRMSMTITAATIITTTMRTSMSITIIITTPTRCSPLGALRPPRSSTRRPLKRRCMSWIPASMAPSSERRVSCPPWTARGFTLTMFPRNATSVPAALILPASSASSAPSWMKQAWPLCSGCKHGADSRICLYRLSGFR